MLITIVFAVTQKGEALPYTLKELQKSEVIFAAILQLLIQGYIVIIEGGTAVVIQKNLGSMISNIKLKN